MTLSRVGGYDVGRDDAIGIAEEWLSSRLAIIDLETTGLDRNDEPVEIAVVDENGHTLLEKLVRPTIPIPKKATNVHGIADVDVKGAQTMEELLPELRQLSDRHWLSYNYEFDSRLLRQGLAARGHHRPPWSGAVDDHCIMRLYHAYYYGGNLDSAPWIGLKEAMQQCELKRIGREHRALSDALAARAVLSYIANQPSRGAVSKQEQG